MKKTTSIEKTKEGCFWQDFITEAGKKESLFTPKKPIFLYLRQRQMNGKIKNRDKPCFYNFINSIQKW